MAEYSPLSIPALKLMSLPSIEELQPPTWVALVTSIALLLLARRWYQSRGLKLPPGPPNLPIVGAMFSMGNELHRVFHSLSQKYGPVMYFKLGVLPVVVVSSPKIAEELLKQRDAEFASRAHSEILYSTAKFFGFGAQGIGFAANTPALQKLRKIATTELLTQSKLSSSQFVKIRVEELSSMVREMNKFVQKGESFLIRDIVHGMTMNVVSRMLFNKQYYGSDIPVTKELQDFKQLMIDMTALAGKLNISDLLPILRWLDPQGLTAEFAKLHGRQRHLVNGILQDHKNKRKDPTEPKDFIDTLIGLDGDDKLTDVQIMSTTSDMLIGGTDTAATTVEWTMVELLRHPEIFRKLQAEIDSVVGKERAVEDADIPNLPYLQAVLKESLRMYPPLTTTIPRMNDQSATKLGGYDIPKKSSVFVNIWAIGRDPSVWPNPDQFIPERFLNEDVGVMGNNFKYLPFGSGRRKCVGITMGQLMTHLTVATLVHAFDLLPPPGKSHSDISNADLFGMVLRPLEPLRVVASPRLPLNLFDKL